MAARADGHRPRPFRATLALAALAFAAPALAQSGPSEQQVKTAMIYNIARFVDWPASQTPKTGPKVTLCILGRDPFGADIDTLTGRPIGSTTLQVRRVSDASAARACQMVYISASETTRLEATLATLGGGHILTLADSSGFAERGVVANLYLDQHRVRFEVNLDAARRSGLGISSQLLHLARITHDRTNQP